MIEAILADFGAAQGRGVVVDSPPGAGKSTLVVRAARTMAEAGERLMVIAQTNEQVDDLIDRLATAAPGLAIGRRVVWGEERVGDAAMTARERAALIAAKG